jgi:hypothetical protein
MNHLFSMLVLAALVAGCRQKSVHGPSAAAPAKHEHKPPHGGTPVVLGNEEYHVEFVLIAVEGKLLAFVMDGELENFVRVAADSFEVNAKLAGNDEILLFHAIANNATGETIGDTSEFEAEADWLKPNTTFDAVLKELTVRTKTYQNVQFNFPKGNDVDEEK